MEKLSVSVIIPIYNEEKYIERCLSSLFKQTLRPLEIIVVDDGSTDSSKRKAQSAKLQAKIKNLILLEQKHRGVARARNLGAKKARGEILVFVDADMRFDRQYLEKLVEPIIAGKAVATFTKEEYVANPENIWSQCWSIDNYLPPTKRIPSDMPDKAWTFRAIKRDIFLKAGGYSDLGYGEDKSVLEKIGKPLAKVAPGAVCYHSNPASISEVFTSARWIGRGEWFKSNLLKALLTYSFFNSLRNGIQRGIKNKRPAYLIFKLVYDFGVFWGILERLVFKIHKK